MESQIRLGSPNTGTREDLDSREMDEKSWRLYKRLWQESDRKRIRYHGLCLWNRIFVHEETFSHTKRTEEKFWMFVIMMFLLLLMLWINKIKRKNQKKILVLLVIFPYIHIQLNALYTLALSWWRHNHGFESLPSIYLCSQHKKENVGLSYVLHTGPLTWIAAKYLPV